LTGFAEKNKLYPGSGSVITQRQIDRPRGNREKSTSKYTMRYTENKGFLSVATRGLIPRR